MMKRRGQNFLVDYAIIERIADYAYLNKRDIILEIGSGTGNLTKILAERAGFVYAIEVDPVLAEGFQNKFDNVKVIKNDALKIDFPDCNKVVSNLPYQISSKIIYRLLTKPFEVAVLMCQLEFAQRMLANPGNAGYGRLSMIVGYFCIAEIVEIVSRSAFKPMPGVESSILRLKPRKDRLKVNELQFLNLVEKLFGNRRKKVKRSLLSLGASREMLEKIDSDLLERRPEELWPDEAANLACLISSRIDQK
ncbi:MAG: 16S rRNA (adenine(1518)-N(6)/adenine(1519)-N(6))-dimethyltransferase RsmA [Methanotrichaceae archaeon]|nr:16S rRNA (adenine(1518)-N(6)/adenine(1519)-N(6))-dimethyltransferase RsmA [Methanotrichaceae archaeon]